jgi:ATP-dependent exoDNAse (exonuclease V) alpha subunit
MLELNEKQQQAVNYIESAKFKNFYGIFGAGGTGKTTAIKSINSRFRVAFTAPTNKAAKVMRDSGCPAANTMTIYSFLGLTVNEATGKITIDKKGRCKSGDYDFLVIDECSMLNDDICGRLRQLGHIKIVLMGDFCQLPPPKATHSPIFKIIGDNHLVLTEQMRQKNAENPLHLLLNSMRTAIDTGDSSKVNFSDFAAQVRDDEKGLNVGVVTTNSVKQWEQWLISAFTDKRGFEALAVAYSNKRVDEINALIHSRIYPDSETYCVGEKLIFQSAKKEDKKIIKNNGDMITVESVVKKQEFVKIGDYKVIIESLLINGEYLTPCDRNQFNIWLELLKTDLNNPRVLTGYTWGELYLLRYRFSDLRHSYCSTVHKAQGSTTCNVFVDMLDVFQMPEPIDIINRCVYTALSRAKYNAIILA